MTDVLYEPHLAEGDPDSGESFRIVETPALMPNQCAVSLRRDDPEGFIDTTNTLPFAAPRVYIGIGALRRMWKFAGLADNETEALRGLLDEANTRILELETELEKADGDLAAVDRLVRRQDGSWSRQARPGRKKGDTRVASNLPNVNRDEDN